MASAYSFILLARSIQLTRATSYVGIAEHLYRPCVGILVQAVMILYVPPHTEHTHPSHKLYCTGPWTNFFSYLRVHAVRLGIRSVAASRSSCCSATSFPMSPNRSTSPSWRYKLSHSFYLCLSFAFSHLWSTCFQDKASAIWISGAFCTMLCFIQKLDSLRFSSFVGLFCALYLCGMIIVTAYNTGMWSHIHPLSLYFHSRIHLNIPFCVCVCWQIGEVSPTVVDLGFSINAFNAVICSLFIISSNTQHYKPKH